MAASNEHDYKLALIDGRSRLDAMEEANFTLVRDGKLDKTLGHAALGLEPLTGGAYAELDPGVDPYAFVVSRNILRRHLTARQKRELIAKLLKADASKSDRQIGETIKADLRRSGRSVRRRKQLGKSPQLRSASAKTARRVSSR